MPRPTLFPPTLACLVAPTSLVAQADALATVSGIVRAERTTTPLAGAEILIDGEALTRSAADGSFTVRIMPGNRVIEVRLVGYGAAAARLELSQGAHVEVDVQLGERPVPLDTVVIEGRELPHSPRLAGFHERREKWPSGQFFTWEDLERMSVPRVSDFFHRVRSIDVHCEFPACFLVPSTGRVLPSFSGGDKRGCQIQYYLDGASYFLGAEGIDSCAPRTSPRSKSTSVLAKFPRSTRAATRVALSSLDAGWERGEGVDGLRPFAG